MGATSDRFAGLLTTGVGVVELREGDKETVERKVRETSVRMVAEKGADVILLGCAGEFSETLCEFDKFGKKLILGFWRNRYGGDGRASERSCAGCWVRRG
jgi:hypothetical protein